MGAQELQKYNSNGSVGNIVREILTGSLIIGKLTRQYGIKESGGITSGFGDENFN